MDDLKRICSHLPKMKVYHIVNTVDRELNSDYIHDKALSIGGCKTTPKVAANICNHCHHTLQGPKSHGEDTSEGPNTPVHVEYYVHAHSIAT